MSENRHITRIVDTLANVLAGLDDGQTAILSNASNQHIHRYGSNFFFPAMSKYTADGVSYTYMAAEHSTGTFYSDSGLTIGEGGDLVISLVSDDVYIKNVTRDKDIYLRIIDECVQKNLVHLDADVAIVRFPQDTGISIGAGNDLTVSLSSDDATIKNTTQDKDLYLGINDGSVEKNLIQLDGDVAIVRFPQDNGISVGAGNDCTISLSSDDLYIKNVTQDKDVYVQINDGSVTKTAILIDASENGRVIANEFVRSSASNYRRYYHIPIQQLNSGASGATFVAPNANNLGGWRVTNATHVLYADTDVHADWDGVSDLTVEIKFAVGASGSAGDTIDLRLQCFYNGNGDTASKSQTIEVATTTDGTIHKVYTAVFTIDYDAVSNIIDVGDNIAFILNLETDTSEIDNAIIQAMTFYYNTTHVGVESGDV
jgi:uncharacterized protein YuzE